MTGFDSYEKAKLDVFKFKNAKYLFFCFNNFLSESNVPIKKIKYSTVTDDFIAAEEIKNQNWQNYIEQFINITQAKQSYNSFYHTVAQSFHSTIEKLTFEKKEEIREDFEREIFL